MKWILIIWAVVISGPALAKISAQNYGDWSLLCGDKGNCALSQVVAKDPQGTQILLGININYGLSDDFPVLVIRLPASAKQSAGLGIKIDDESAVQLPMSQCNNKACQAVIKMDDIIINQMRSGKTMRLAFASVSQNQQTLPVSLIEFEQAWLAFQEAHQHSLKQRK